MTGFSGASGVRVCPRCDDRADKVRVMVEAGTSSLRTEYGETHVVRTDLASDLAPPREPAYESPWGCFSVVLMFLGLLSVVLAVATLNGFGNASSEELAASAPQATVGLIVFIVVIVIAISVFVARTKEADKRRRQFESDHKGWRKAMSVWKNNLYFCPGEDVLFRDDYPDFSVPRSRSNMLALVYEAS
jgi:hypothetical protein